MPKIQIKNAKGLFASTSFVSVITDRGLEHLKNSLPQIEKERPKLLAAAKKIVELCDALPSMPIWIAAFGKNDLDGQALANAHAMAYAPYGYGWGEGRGWLSVGNFVSKSHSNPPEVKGALPQALGWGTAEQLHKLEKPFKEIAQYLEISEPNLSRAKDVAKKSQEWIVEARDRQTELSRAESFAVYIASSEGYLNDKGEAAPLAGARLFESAAAADRTISSRKLSGDAVVVGVSARITSLDPIRPAASDLGALTEAFAAEEARAIQEAIRAVDIDTLRKRLSELEALAGAAAGVVGSELGDERPAAKTPRRRL